MKLVVRLIMTILLFVAPISALAADGFDVETAVLNNVNAMSEEIRLTCPRTADPKKCTSDYEGVIERLRKHRELYREAIAAFRSGDKALYDAAAEKFEKNRQESRLYMQEMLRRYGGTTAATTDGRGRP